MTEEELSELGLTPGGHFARRYEIARRLGAGAMGIVFEAIDCSLKDERLALKVFNPAELDQGEQLRERFRNEVLITRKLSHPNIVRTFDLGEIGNGLVYMTMELIHGRSLEDILRKAPGRALPVEQAALIVQKIAEAMEYAHSLGVIHRDLKPANVLLSSKGEVKVTDFGLAQSLHAQQKLTSTGECVGTPVYMSPERVLGEPSDHRADIYALGILAYELVMGGVPFGRKGWFELADQIVNEPLPKLTGGKSKVPRWYEEMVLRATEKSPGDRFSSAKEMLEILVTKVAPPVKRRKSIRRGLSSARLSLRRRREKSEEAPTKLPNLLTVPLRALWPPALGLLFLLGTVGMKDFLKERSLSEALYEFVDTPSDEDIRPIDKRPMRVRRLQANEPLEVADEIDAPASTKSKFKSLLSDTLEVLEDVGIIRRSDSARPKKTPNSKRPERR